MSLVERLIVWLALPHDAVPSVIKVMLFVPFWCVRLVGLCLLTTILLMRALIFTPSTRPTDPCDSS